MDEIIKIIFEHVELFWPDRQPSLSKKHLSSTVESGSPTGDTKGSYPIGAQT